MSTNIKMIFTPAHTYPSSYDESISEIDLKCSCHKGWISGHAKRVGLTELEDYPVYKIISSRQHPDLINERIALSPNGFVQPINPVKKAQTHAHTTTH